MYFNKLKDRVELLRPLLAKIQKRETIAQERIELEHIQLNPERLTARGPKAREDRKREEAMTVRVKNLDKLTKEVSSLLFPLLYTANRVIDCAASATLGRNPGHSFHVCST